jgi:streptogramin lyase
MRNCRTLLLIFGALLLCSPAFGNQSGSSKVYVSTQSGEKIVAVSLAADGSTVTGVTELLQPSSLAGSRFEGLVYGPDELLYACDPMNGRIIRFDPKTEEFARAIIPSGGGTVRNMVATSDGRVYIACSGVNKVGVVEPAR